MIVHISCLRKQATKLSQEQNVSSSCYFLLYKYTVYQPGFWVNVPFDLSISDCGIGKYSFLPSTDLKKLLPHCGLIVVLFCCHRNWQLVATASRIPRSEEHTSELQSL